MFLEERSVDTRSIELLRERPWTYVVLQAQKYSSSGMFEYPTAGAEALVRMARGQGACRSCFPSGRASASTETQRIYDLHVSIARKEPACVAPVGRRGTWRAPGTPRLALHNADGNHSAPAGAFLAALGDRGDDDRLRARPVALPRRLRRGRGDAAHAARDCRGDGGDLLAAHVLSWRLAGPVNGR